MPENTSNNKRIAKNTVYLYFRTILIMLITLYTSRVVLNTLGVDDYGIYNVVGGVVVMVSFVSNALSTGTQRHISIELGKEDGDIPKIFSACFKIHLLLSAILLILAESVGLWFLNAQMNIPDSRMHAANIVYQFAVASFIVNVIKTPYNASVIAYERMSFYAYISIVEAILKLSAVYILLLCSYDKLAFYSFFTFIATLIVTMSLVAFSHKRLAGIRIVKVGDKKLYKYLLSFSGWTLFGSVSGMAETQGLNMAANIFYGVKVNAAVGIANQVRNAVRQFVAGFQQALNPQLVMSQSQGDRIKQFDLIIKSSKYSFYILWLIACPIILNIDYILNLWLGIVPQYTTHICLLALIVEMFECMSSPLYTTIFAIGNIKRYQIIVSLFRITSFLLGLIICQCGMDAYLVYMPPCLIAAGLLVYRLLFIRKAIGFPLKMFMTDIAMPVGLTVLLMLSALVGFKHYSCHNMSFYRLVAESIVAIAFALFVIITVGLRRNERKAIVNLALQKMLKNNNSKI